MTTRRELLTALPAFLLPEPANFKEPVSKIAALTDDLAAAMAREYACEWSWKLDEKGEFLIMTRIERAGLQ